MAKRTWSQEPWKVMLNAIGGVDGTPAITAADAPEQAIANGDPNQLIRATDCVNVMAGVVPKKKGASVRRLIESIHALEEVYGSSELRELVDQFELLANEG